jgi:hypothetical protein
MDGGVVGNLTCNGTWQYYGTPRQVAGGPLSSDVMKCQLKPLVRSDYGAAFTDAQWATLQATFPAGVCDYSQPGVAQQGPKARWLTFANGPGGTPLGDSPVPQPYRPREQLADLLDWVVQQNVGPGASVSARLREAIAMLDAGRPGAACVVLGALDTQVRVQTGRHITPEQAAWIRGDVAAIRNALGC